MVTVVVTAVARVRKRNTHAVLAPWSTPNNPKATPSSAPATSTAKTDPSRSLADHKPAREGRRPRAASASAAPPTPKKTTDAPTRPERLAKKARKKGDCPLPERVPAGWATSTSPRTGSPITAAASGETRAPRSAKAPAILPLAAFEIPSITPEEIPRKRLEGVGPAAGLVGTSILAGPGGSGGIPSAPPGASGGPDRSVRRRE